MKTIVVLVFQVLTVQLFYGQEATSNIITPKQKKSSFNRVFEGEPGKAALYSLLLPGAGQYYNKSYIKIPLVLAGEGYAVYNLSQQLRTFNQFNNCHIALANGESEPIICNGQNDVNAAFSNAQTARSNKETAWMVMAGAHLLNVLDAFIHRHLINFDTSTDLSSQHSYMYKTPIFGPQITFVSIKIPLSQ